MKNRCNLEVTHSCRESGEEICLSMLKDVEYTPQGSPKNTSEIDNLCSKLHNAFDEVDSRIQAQKEFRKDMGWSDDKIKRWISPMEDTLECIYNLRTKICRCVLETLPQW